MQRYAVCTASSGLEVFGAAARGSDLDLAKSDVDLLVTFDDATVATDYLQRYLGFADALEALYGRSVDLVELGSIDASLKYTRRRAILREAVPIYGGLANSRLRASSEYIARACVDCRRRKRHLAAGFESNKFHKAGCRASVTADGLRPITIKYARAAASGSLRPCSQSLSVPSGI